MSRYHSAEFRLFGGSVCSAVNLQSGWKNDKKKEDVDMPRGFFWGGGFWGRGGYGWPGFGWGRGNPYPFCRAFPWMPRGWWALGLNPYSYGYTSTATAPYYGSTSYWTPGTYPYYYGGYPYWGWGAPAFQSKEQELDYLKQQSEMIQNELRQIEDRIKDLESRKE